MVLFAIVFTCWVNEKFLKGSFWVKANELLDFLFFFSSRRRHTRYWRDWSSDVCSSDLDHGRGRVRRTPLVDHFAQQLLTAHDKVAGRRELGGQRVQQRQVAGCGLEEGRRRDRKSVV